MYISDNEPDVVDLFLWIKHCYPRSNFFYTTWNVKHSFLKNIPLPTHSRICCVLEIFWFVFPSFFSQGNHTECDNQRDQHDIKTWDHGCSLNLVNGNALGLLYFYREIHLLKNHCLSQLRMKDLPFCDNVSRFHILQYIYFLSDYHSPHCTIKHLVLQTHDTSLQLSGYIIQIRTLYFRWLKLGLRRTWRHWYVSSTWKSDMQVSHFCIVFKYKGVSVRVLSATGPVSTKYVYGHMSRLDLCQVSTIFLKLVLHEAWLPTISALLLCSTLLKGYYLGHRWNRIALHIHRASIISWCKLNIVVDGRTSPLSRDF